MALVVIDGHNAAFGLRLQGHGESGKRQALLDLLQKRRSDDTVWVVFDSKHNDEQHGYWLQSYAVRVVYAPGSFDDWIVAEAGSGGLDSDTVVVTNDWDLRLKLSGRVICRGLADYFGSKRRGIW